jgi:hypothetical protein
VGGAPRREVHAVNRWITRSLGILMLLFFMFIFVLMYKQLVAISNMRQQPAATSTRLLKPLPKLLSKSR